MKDFLNILSLLNCVLCVLYVPKWSTCPRRHVPTFQKRANWSFLRANVLINVPKACQFFKFASQYFNLACQRAKMKRVIFSPSLAKRCANSLKAHSQVWDNFWQLEALSKWWKVLFISPKKLFSFSRYFNFCFDILVM